MTSQLGLVFFILCVSALINNGNHSHYKEEENPLQKWTQNNHDKIDINNRAHLIQMKRVLG